MRHRYRSFFFVLFTLLAFAVPSAVGAHPGSLPLRVRMVLMKVQPLMEKEAFDKAAGVLEAYRSRGSGPEDTLYEHPEINFVLGNCYIQTGKLKQARACYRRTVTRKTGHRGAWQNLAKTEYDLGNHTKASEAFLKSYQLSESREPELLYYASVALFFAGHYEQGLVHFHKLLDTHPEAVTLEWKENLVYGLIQAEKNRQALPVIVELTEGFGGKKQRRWREILLQQYLTLDMRKDALSLVMSLSRNDPTEPVWWKALVHIQLQDEQYNKALAALTIYSFLTPLEIEEEKLLGDLYLQQGVPRKAVVRYENFNKKKIDKQTILCLARAYIDIGRPELALKRLKSLPALEKDQEVMMLHGEILYTMKQFEQAAEVYRDAASIEGRHGARAYLMAGYSYWQLGETDNARSCFQKAAQQKQCRNEAQRAMRQLEEIVLSSI